jgi:type III secretory pathway component EscU
LYHFVFLVVESLKSFLKVCLMSLFFEFRFFCVQSLKKNVVLLRMSNVDASQLAPIKAQVAACIPHN